MKKSIKKINKPIKEMVISIKKNNKKKMKIMN